MAHTNWIYLLVITCFKHFTGIGGFNIHEEHVDVFSGESESLFGYSVLQHENSQGKWILVGAPKSSSVHQRSLTSPGALFKCLVNERSTTTANQRCQQVGLDMAGNEHTIIDGVPVIDFKDEQWLGVTLDSHRKNESSGKVVVCGHRWVNNYDGFYKKYYEYPYGICYTIDSELHSPSVQKLRPCLKGTKVSSSGIPWYGWCQAGTSAHYTNDGTLLLGAPGTIGWRGTVISMAQPEPQFVDWSVWYPNGEAEEGYVGYSLSSGSFTSPTAKEGVTGAPRTHDIGKVFIFDLTHGFIIKKELYGEPMNTYFGSSLAAVDLNNDGLSDLLVGAPLYTDEMDEGRVYVYINQGQANLQLYDKLKGNNAIGGRFGTAIAAVGDLNQDGYQDVAIGAPFEDDGSGAVYIYHGSVLGIKTQYEQRLAGKTVNRGLTSFGSSLSGGMDMDGNGYPDIVVGAHQNATVVYYRSQPVLTVEKSLRLNPEVLSPNTTMCSLGGRPVTCIHIKLCLRYTGHRVPAEIGFSYTIAADIMRINQGISSRFFFTNQKSDNSQVNEFTVLQLDQERCVEHTAYLKTDVRDFLNTIPFQSTFSLHPDSRVDPTSNLPITLNHDYPHTITREAAFVRDCGTNAICETDMQVSSRVETARKSKVLYLEAESRINVDVEVTNNGEEAHQAKLTVTYPSDVVYIGFEPILGGMLPCDPQVGSNGLQCRLGNPMTANSKARFKLRFDVSSLLATRESLNFTVVVHTSSIETNDTLYDNTAEPSIPVLLFADIIVRGASLPEQAIYTLDGLENQSLDPYLKDIEQVVKEIEKHKGIRTPASFSTGPSRDLKKIVAVSQNNSVLHEGVTESESKVEADEGLIGPSVVFTYEVRNLGPSYIPFSSYVNITIPWMTKSGDRLVYIKGLRAIEGVEACNMREVLIEQSTNLKEKYKWNGSTSSNSVSESEEEDEKLLQYKSGVFKLDCNAVSCVTITCHIKPLHIADSVVIELHTLLWKYTFLKHEIGVAGMITEASVMVEDSTRRFTQPENHRSDKVKVITTITAERFELKIKPIPPWVIIAATAGGVVALIVLIIVMARFGFFHRISQEEMEKLLAENHKQSGNTNGINHKQYFNGTTEISSLEVPDYH